MEKNRILSNTEENYLFNICNVTVNGTVNNDNLFYDNGGRIIVNNIIITKYSEIYSFVNVKEKGSILYIFDTDFEDVVVINDE